MVTEDFETAFEERAADVEALCAAGRQVLAMHIGGVVVECLLKAILVDSLPPNKQGIREWKTDENNPGHTIERPGHHYHEIVCKHQKLLEQVRGNHAILKWFDDVERPLGHFIDMRYIGRPVSPKEIEAAYKCWRSSYMSLVGWLQKRRTELAKKHQPKSKKGRKP